MSIRVLGIDTSLRATGVGIIECSDGRLRGLGFDVLRNPASRPLAACLLHLQRELTAVLAEYKPDVAAIEGVFYARYARTALLLGHARGVAIAACAAAGANLFVAGSSLFKAADMAAAIAAMRAAAEQAREEGAGGHGG